MERVRTFGGSYGLDALALLFAAISVARLWDVAPRGAAPLLALAATVPLVARRRWPLAAPVLALAALLALSVLCPRRRLGTAAALPRRPFVLLGDRRGY